MKYAKGICWVDDTRIPFVDEVNFDLKPNRSKKVYGGNSLLDSKTEYTNTDYNQQGRFTPSLLVCDDMLNDGSVGVSSSKERKNKLPQNIYGSGKGIPPQTSKGFGDKGTNSRYYDLDKWFDKVINEIR